MDETQITRIASLCPEVLATGFSVKVDQRKAKAMRVKAGVTELRVTSVRKSAVTHSTRASLQFIAMVFAFILLGSCDDPNEGEGPFVPFVVLIAEQPDLGTSFGGPLQNCLEACERNVECNYALFHRGPPGFGDDIGRCTKMRDVASAYYDGALEVGGNRAAFNAYCKADAPPIGVIAGQGLLGASRCFNIEECPISAQSFEVEFSENGRLTEEAETQLSELSDLLLPACSCPAGQTHRILINESFEVIEEANAPNQPAIVTGLTSSDIVALITETIDPEGSSQDQFIYGQDLPALGDSSVTTRAIFEVSTYCAADT